MSKVKELYLLAPKNHNVNGIYYDESSYQKALSNFLKCSQPLYDGYDNDTKYYKSNTHHVIGTLTGIVDKHRAFAEVELDSDLQFITPAEYVIGFKLVSSGSYHCKDDNTERYVINKILYATLIHVDFLK